LDEGFYDQVGDTACADYRHLINGYWKCIGIDESDSRPHTFILLQRRNHWVEE